MKEIKSIINAYKSLESQGKKMALATVVHVEDSSYRRSGARMLITEDGNWTGGISGGCLEGDTLKKAQFSIFKKETTSVRYDTRDNDPDEIGVGLGCNGLIDVLITPLDGENMPISVLESCTLDRTPSLLLTIVDAPQGLLHKGALIPFKGKSNFKKTYSHLSISDELLMDIETVKTQEKSSTHDYISESGAWRIFIEFVPPPIHLIICGKNYDTLPLAQIARDIGWKVSVITNPSKVSKSLFSLVEKVYPIEGPLPTLDPYTVALLMTHDYKTDKAHFTKFINKDLPYIGILGPKKRSDRLFNELRSEGLVFDTDKVFAPIGLDTGATSPEEIAISMIAEIRTCFSKRNGGFLRDRQGKIND